MVVDRVKVEANRIMTWVGDGGSSNHPANLLQIEKDDNKPLGPFKSNPKRLEKEELKMLIRQNWMKYDPSNENLAMVESFHKAKNPSPNGWTMEYYLEFHNLIEDDLLRW